MKKGIDPSNELTSEALKYKHHLTSDPRSERGFIHIIAVPTPTIFITPDLTPVLRASETVGRILKKEIRCYESQFIGLHGEMHSCPGKSQMKLVKT